MALGTLAIASELPVLTHVVVVPQADASCAQRPYLGLHAGRSVWRRGGDHETGGRSAAGVFLQPFRTGNLASVRLEHV